MANDAGETSKAVPTTKVILFGSAFVEHLCRQFLHELPLHRPDTVEDMAFEPFTLPPPSQYHLPLPIPLTALRVEGEPELLVHSLTYERPADWPDQLRKHGCIYYVPVRSHVARHLLMGSVGR